MFIVPLCPVPTECYLLCTFEFCYVSPAQCFAAQMVRNTVKQDIVLELAMAGAFSGSLRDYLLPHTQELDELVASGVVGQSMSKRLYHLTPIARTMLVPTLNLKMKAPLENFCRGNKPVDDLSLWEIIKKLERHGWDSETRAPGSRVGLYKSGRCKKTWYRPALKPVSRNYLLACLSADKLLEKGLPGLAHMQCESYYRAALHFLETDPSKLSQVVPNKEGSFYQHLLGQRSNTISSTNLGIQVDNELSVFDQLEMLQNQTFLENVGGQENANANADEDSAEKRTHMYRRLYIRQQDLYEFGFSEHCNACKILQAGTNRSGANHSEECRERIMSRLEATEDGRERLKALAEREDSFLAQLSDQRALLG